MSRLDEFLDAPPPSWAKRFWFDVRDDVARRRYLWLVGALVAAGAFGFLLTGAQGPPDPELLEHSARSGIPGFDEMAFRVRPSPLRAGAEELEAETRCALLADTPAQHAQGLQDRSDLGGYDAMLFRFDTDVTYSFHMRNVPVPLSIAWFDAGGRFVGAADMAPCPTGDCEQSWFAPAPYRYALEVPQGRFADFGVGAGSRLILAGVCPEPEPQPVG